MIKNVRIITDFSQEKIELLVTEAASHCFPLHIHKNFCIGKIMTGEMTIIYENDVQQLAEGEVFFIPANKPH